MKQIVSFLAAFLALFVVPSLAFATTPVSGTLAADTTWTKEGSPYVVGNAFVVPVGITLTVEPGAVVKFNFASSITRVKGRILAHGTEAEPIVFTSIHDDLHGGDTNGDGDATEPSSGDWEMQIESKAASPSEFSHAVFSYAENIALNNSAFVSMEHARISDMLEPILLFRTSRLTLDHVRIENSLDSGIEVYDRSQVFLFNSEILGTLDAAIELYGSAATLISSTLTSGADTGVELYYDRFADTMSSLTMDGSTVGDFLDTGIESYDSSVLIEDSTITENEAGIIISTRNRADTSYVISNSSIADNLEGVSVFPSGVGVGATLAHAENNWWGDSSGPYHGATNPEGMGDGVTNFVEFTPWLTEDPFDAAPPEPELPECCSSVAFLPGLEASRLYRHIDGGALGTFKKRLWEPEILHNNSDIFLNSDGTPQTTGIYTKDVIDETYAGANIYESFISSMNALVSDGTISEWKPFPYDWRFDIDDIVENPIALESSSYSMIDEIIRMASSSPTKKVSIIAHSNGGLVGKELISKLEELGKGDTVDKFIMVAVPQLGTPKAVTSMLHGEGLPTSFPVLLSKEDSRILAENMPSAYNLLPSAEYFNRVIDPVATFNPDDPLAAQYFAEYNFHVSNPTEFHNFLLGVEGRTKPSTDDLFTPNILNRALLTQGEINHVSLDTWLPPAGVEVIQIVGWGLDTIKGIKYTERWVCDGFLCSRKLNPEPEFTSDGDETVVTPSASAIATSTYWVNLRNYNAEFFGARINRKHGDIFEATPLDKLVEDLVQNKIETITHVTTIKPTPNSNDEASLRLKVFSPVSLDIYDSFGNHTGVSTSTDLGDVILLDEEIANSYYMELGEGKYAGSQKSGTTTVQLTGESSGTFIFIAEEIQGDEVTASTTFAGIPVIASSTATFSISETGNIASTTLAIDVDGDGMTDIDVTPGDGVAEEELVAILKAIVKTLNLSDEKERKLLKAFEKLEKELAKERNGEEQEKKKTNETFDKLIARIKKFEEKKLLTEEEVDGLISIIEQIMGEVVE